MFEAKAAEAESERLVAQLLGEYHLMVAERHPLEAEWRRREAERQRKQAHVFLETRETNLCMADPAMTPRKMALLTKCLTFNPPERKSGEKEVAYRLRCMDALGAYDVGFHLPTAEGIVAIANAALAAAADGSEPCLVGLGSGRAFPERIVHDFYPNIAVYATDPFLTHDTGAEKKYMPVMVLTAMEAFELLVKNNPNIAVLFVFPNYDDPWSGEVLRRIVEIATTATRVVHVGDTTPGGFTGSALFHELLESHFECVETAGPASWPFREDVVAVYKFKGSTA
jgi:hypothetical protein